MKRIKVLLFVGSLEIGGAERNVLHIARGLDRERFDVEVWCNYAGQALESAFREAGVPCRHLKEMSIGRNPLVRLFCYNLPYQWRLWNILRRNRDAVIHVFGFPMIWYVVLLGALAGARRVLLSIQDWDVWKKGALCRGLDRLCSRLAWRITSDGAGAARLAVERQGMDARKMRVIYDGVDTDELTADRPREAVRREMGLSPPHVAVSVIARLDMRKKGQDTLLAAARDIHARCPNVRIFMVGDGPDRSALEALAAGLPLGARPVFTGFRSDLANVINASDIIVIPSRWESVPKILLEAMWMRKPVAATRVGDIREILDRSAGLLVPPDDPPALADAVALLAEDRRLRRSLRRSGRRIIVSRSLTLDASVAQYEAEYVRAFERAQRRYA